MIQLTRALPLLAGLGLAALAATAGLAGPDGSAVQCEIVEHSQNDMRTIEALVTSPSPASGDYRLAIASRGNGNSSSISQGGAFTVPANETIAVGQMMIGDDARYSVDFSITLDGRTIDCTRPGARFT
tara:strand:- start:506 stop:889 length:384 start_codon:yes stop_codon:yes gene_type:complete